MIDVIEELKTAIQTISRSFVTKGMMVMPRSRSVTLWPQSPAVMGRRSRDTRPMLLDRSEIGIVVGEHAGSVLVVGRSAMGWQWAEHFLVLNDPWEWCKNLKDAP